MLAGAADVFHAAATQLGIVGEGAAQLRSDIDAAYRTTFGHYGSSSVDSMVSAAAAAATLQISPDRQATAAAPLRAVAEGPKG